MSSSDSEADNSTSTLVPAAVQHIYKTGCPSHRGVKESVDARERPSRAGGGKRKRNLFPNPKPNKQQLLAQPITNYQPETRWTRNPRVGTP